MMSTRQHKMAALTWVAVYPLITILSIVLEPVTMEIALPVRTLLMSAIMVPAMVYVAMPFLSRRFGPHTRNDKRTAL